MKRLKYIMWYTGLLAISACSSERIAPDGETEQNIDVHLAAGISESDNSSRSDNNTYIKTAFTTNDEIRLVNTVFFNTPDFTNENTIFTYAGIENNKYKFTQSSQNDTSGNPDGTGSTDDTQPIGITWNDFSPTSFVYMFEAVYYPGNELFSSVPSDQSNVENFKKADLLIAHHRMPLEDRYKDIELTFHHAFAMVKVEATVPTGVGGLPKNAIQEASMINVQTAYHVDYTATIQNNGLRTVKGIEDENYPRTNVKMWLQSITENTAKKTQTYTFLGIIPVPNPNDPNEPIIVQDDFIHFEVKVDDKTTKTYRFVPKENAIHLEQAHITVLKLQLGKNGVLPLLLSAEIAPWTQASAGMILDEEDPTDNTLSGGNSSDNQQGGNQSENQQGGTEP